MMITLTSMDYSGDNNSYSNYPTHEDESFGDTQDDYGYDDNYSNYDNYSSYADYDNDINSSIQV